MMRAIRRLAPRLLLLILLVVVNPACRATPPAEELAPDPTPMRDSSEMQPTEIATAETPAIEAPPTGQPAAQPSPTAEPTEEPAATPSPALLLNIAGLAEISLLTPEEGASAKPRFEWEAVDGATSYTLILYHPNGEPYWAWQGEGTAVYLGGGDPDVPPPADSAGPVLLDGMTWAVMAADAQGRLLASSPVRPISP